MRAILSVSDKTGIADFANGLTSLNIEIFSTGGTKKSLESAGIKIHSVSELTGFPEILDGRVKTLHPMVHGGILARRDNAKHVAELKEKGIGTIDIVAVNLYPFVQTVSRPDVSLQEALENIDIGGPTMIRAAAKNFPGVIVVVDPADYDIVLNQLRQVIVDITFRKKLAQKAFQHVALYDTAIARYLREPTEIFPENLTVALKKLYDLRYGENPHQKAAFYSEEIVPTTTTTNIASAKILSGKELSFNNILDLDSAMAVVSDFNEPTITIIKHNNPCGLCSNNNLTEAYKNALAGDPIAAFGGVVGSNIMIDLETAKEIDKTHFDAIIAPCYETSALELLRRKKDLRMISLGLKPETMLTRSQYIDIRHVSGGFLLQTSDSSDIDPLTLKTVTRRSPSDEEMRDLLFGYSVVKHIKSNAIVLIKNKVLLGMGAGQPSRVMSVEIAIKKAGEYVRGSVLASDAFFPFADGVELAAKAGVTAIIQPGGSIRDADAIDVSNKYNIAMIFTGIRHFKH